MMPVPNLNQTPTPARPHPRPEHGVHAAASHDRNRPPQTPLPSEPCCKLKPALPAAPQKTPASASAPASPAIAPRFSRVFSSPLDSWSLLSNRAPGLFAEAATTDLGVSRCSAAASTPLSLAPGFNRVFPGGRPKNRFNGFALDVGKTAAAVAGRSLAYTRFQPGANERPALAHAPQLFSRRQWSAVPPVQVLPLSFEL